MKERSFEVYDVVEVLEDERIDLKCKKLWGEMCDDLDNMEMSDEEVISKWELVIDDILVKRRRD